jgi:hypothetical protein
LGVFRWCLLLLVLAASSSHSIIDVYANQRTLFLRAVAKALQRFLRADFVLADIWSDSLSLMADDNAYFFPFSDVSPPLV